MRHQIGDHMFTVRTARQTAHVSSLESFIEKGAASLERQRAEAPPVRLCRRLERSDLRRVSRRWRWSRLHQARFPIAVGQRNSFLVLANPAEKVVDSFVLPFTADRRR